MSTDTGTRIGNKRKKNIYFIDSEIETASKKVLDIGAVADDGREFHGGSLPAFTDFLHGAKTTAADPLYICGHNITHHDLLYLEESIQHLEETIQPECRVFYIDTLYLSPLLLPKKLHHRLDKDDKLLTDELNNPLNDAKKARDLFFDEATAYKKLDKRMQQIYAGLLADIYEFKGFFRYVKQDDAGFDIELIYEMFSGKICKNSPVKKLAQKYPVELAYALAQINAISHNCVLPPWVLRNYPRIENTIHFLRNRKCGSCDYCDNQLNEKKALKRYFNFKGFRDYDGEPLQQTAVRGAIEGKSILVVFPTGGGKSLTFQLPALMAGVNEKGLTVVISPLQSLMKDQIDSLEHDYNITEAVTINGALDPIERAQAIERVESGAAAILYIAPESLRSKTIENVLLKRKYSTGQNLQYVLRLLRDFENVCGKVKYKSDMKQYISESRLEELESDSGGAVLVSTIHQTKGREFDNVFLAYSGYMSSDDATSRSVYVAITRAKQNLHIFCNGDYFDRIDVRGITRTCDETDYPAPPVVCMNLSHKDVALSYFRYRQREISSLAGGQELIAVPGGCLYGGKQVLKFSARFGEILSELENKGYLLKRACIRHIVYWQGKDMDKEIKIILPDLELEKHE